MYTCVCGYYHDDTAKDPYYKEPFRYLMLNFSDGNTIGQTAQVAVCPKCYTMKCVGVEP